MRIAVPEMLVVGRRGRVRIAPAPRVLSVTRLPTLSYAAGSPASRWANADNIKAEDGTPATKETDVVTLALGAYGYGFADGAGAIPAGAKPLGVRLRAVRKASIPGAKDSQVQLYDITRSPAGNNLATPTDWPAEYGEKVYGGSSDLWGLALTRDWIVHENFGVELIANPTGGLTLMSVDLLAEITVYYMG